MRVRDVEHDGVVHHAVQDGGGDDVVAEHFTPSGQASVGRDQGGGVFGVAVIDDVEEGAGDVAGHRQQANVVDDQHGGGGVGAQLGGPGPFDAGPAQGGDHVVGGSE